MLASNCYVLGDQREAAVIDPGVDCSEILEAAEKNGLSIKYILLTHVHIDHVLHMDELRDKTGAQVLVHEKDAPALGDPWFNGSRLFGVNKVFGPADRLLKDGDSINLGSLTLEIIHTPGHTPGGICIKAGNSLFTGDTLFMMSIGRTDLGNGDETDLMDSIRSRLMKLEDAVTVYPGHGTSTTIGYERANNPYI